MKCSGFALLANGLYMAFESVTDESTGEQRMLLVSTADRFEPISVAEPNGGIILATKLAGLPSTRNSSA